MRTLSWGFPTRIDTNRAVQPQEMARGLTFRFKDGEILYTVLHCSERKCADQLRGYRAAILCLCFHIRNILRGIS